MIALIVRFKNFETPAPGDIREIHSTVVLLLRSMVTSHARSEMFSPGLAKGYRSFLPAIDGSILSFLIQ